MLSKNDKFIRQSVAVTYLFISIVAMLYRDNVHIKRVRTKNGGCEQKPLKSHFYINIIFFSRKFTEIIKSERLKKKDLLLPATWQVHTPVKGITMHFRNLYTPRPRHGKTIVIIVSKSKIWKVGFLMQITVQASPICIWNPVQQYDWNLLFKSVTRNSYIFCFLQNPKIF